MAAALALLALATTRHRSLTLQPTTTTPRQLPATRRRCRRRPFTFVVLNSRAARARLESLLRDAGGSSTTLGTGPVDLVWSNARRVSKAEAAAAAAATPHRFSHLVGFEWVENKATMGLLLNAALLARRGGTRDVVEVCDEARALSVGGGVRVPPSRAPVIGTLVLRNAAAFLAWARTSPDKDETNVVWFVKDPNANGGFGLWLTHLPTRSCSCCERVGNQV